MQGSYMISLVPCKDRTMKYVMICMTSYMILVWNQGSSDPGLFCNCYFYFATNMYQGVYKRCKNRDSTFFLIIDQHVLEQF